MRIARTSLILATSTIIGYSSCKSRDSNSTTKQIVEIKDGNTTGILARNTSDITSIYLKKSAPICDSPDKFSLPYDRTGIFLFTRIVDGSGFFNPAPNFDSYFAFDDKATSEKTFFVENEDKIKAVYKQLEANRDISIRFLRYHTGGPIKLTCPNGKIKNVDAILTEILLYNEKTQKRERHFLDRDSVGTPGNDAP